MDILDWPSSHQIESSEIILSDRLPSNGRVEDVASVDTNLPGERHSCAGKCQPDTALEASPAIRTE